MVAPTRVVDRAFDEACIEWNINNIDGDVASTFDLPAGFGDCALMECSIEVNTIATLQTAFDTSGVWFQLLSGGVAQDVGFCGRWQLREADRVCAWAAPDQVQFWKENEALLVGFPEIDTNASPTADMAVFAKVRRLRPLLQGDPHPDDRHFFLTS